MRAYVHMRIHSCRVHAGGENWVFASVWTIHIVVGMWACMGTGMGGKGEGDLSGAGLKRTLAMGREKGRSWWNCANLGEGGGWLGGGKEVGGYAPLSTPFTYNAQNPIYTHTYM